MFPELAGLDELGHKARAKDRTPPLDIFDGPIGQGRKIRTDGDPLRDDHWSKPAVDPHPFKFTEGKKATEYAPPSHNAEYLRFKHDLDAGRARGDLAAELDQLERQIRSAADFAALDRAEFEQANADAREALQRSMAMVKRETARAHLERTDMREFRATASRETANVDVLRAQLRPAVAEARRVIAEARSEGATDAEIMAEARTLGPVGEAIYRKLLF